MCDELSWELIFNFTKIFLNAAESALLASIHLKSAGEKSLRLKESRREFWTQ